MTTTGLEPAGRPEISPRGPEISPRGPEISSCGRGLSLRAWLPSLALIAVTAFLLRLVPVLSGGGLYGRGNYDDGVYYAAAAGFVHGLLPYRDFLLLHPPGIVLALTPFAALAGLVGDPTALAVGRVTFMMIGAVNAVLVAVVLRRLGLAAALTGGLLYAVALPAVYVEHTTLLEPLATTCLVAALALLGYAHRTTPHPVPALVTAGALLGVSSSIKIWGVILAAAVLIGVLVMLGWRRALIVAGGGLAGAVAICGPFFAAAPVQMWQLVVVSQLGRPPTGTGWVGRAWMITGLSAFGRTPVWWALLLAGLIVAAATVAAWQSPVGRLAVGVLAATLVLLFAMPSWFLHYAALSVAPLALVIGAAAGWVAARVRRLLPALVAVVVGGGLLAGYAGTVVQLPFGRPFPAAALTASVAGSKTCVTTDNPISLIELDVLRRNMDRGCPLVVDLGGYSYYLQPHRPDFVSRRANTVWQSMAIDYLRSGDVTIGLRFDAAHGYRKTTVRTIASWPVAGPRGKGHGPATRGTSGRLSDAASARVGIQPVA